MKDDDAGVFRRATGKAFSEFRRTLLQGVADWVDDRRPPEPLDLPLSPMPAIVRSVYHLRTQAMHSFYRTAAVMLLPNGTDHFRVNIEPLLKAGIVQRVRFVGIDADYVCLAICEVYHDEDHHARILMSSSSGGGILHDIGATRAEISEQLEEFKEYVTRRNLKVRMRIKLRPGTEPPACVDLPGGGPRIDYTNIWATTEIAVHGFPEMGFRLAVRDEEAYRLIRGTDR